MIPFDTLYDQAMMACFGPLIEEIYNKAKVSVAEYKFSSNTYFSYDAETIRQKYPLIFKMSKNKSSYLLNVNLIRSELEKLVPYIQKISKNTVEITVEHDNNYSIFTLTVKNP